jgi:methyl-galactoside transport system substrate-binding protein
MKKLLSILLASVLVFSLAACNNNSGGGGTTTDNNTTTTTESGGGATTYNVGVAIYQFDDNFMTLYRQEIQSYFKSLETDTVKYNVTVVDSKNDMAEQTNQVDTFIAQGVDVMIINLVQSSSASIITAKAQAAGIPVVYINREPSAEDMAAWDKICYVGADARQSGTFQGEIIRDLPDNGDVDGDGVVRYVMIIGDPENVDAQYRTEFSIKALTDAGIAVDELFAQRGDWATEKGQELAANALAQFGSQIDVIFCNNDGMAMGAMTSIEAAGRVVGEDIYLVGVDAIPEAIDAIAAGRMTGTVLNDHIGQSHAAVNAAVDYLNGRAVNTMIIVDYAKVQ